MNVETAFKAADQQALVHALLAYHASPGSYALALGQPDRVFQNLDTVIMWAMGRVAEEYSDQESKLQQAAVFFVQRACFRQENTYFEVMGLGRYFSPDALRARYRALMSLTHPDKAMVGFPSDAAVRINQAYEMLSSPDSRREYELTLQGDLVNEPTSMVVISPPFTLYKLTLRDRIQALQAKNSGVFRTMMFVIPVFLGGIAIVLVTSQNPSDQLLVAKSTFVENPELDLVRVEQPKPMAALSTHSNMSDGDRLSQNSIHIPPANLNANIGKMIASAPQESYSPRNKVKVSIAQSRVVSMTELTPSTPLSLPAPINTLPFETLKPLMATKAESIAPLNLKFASTLQAIPEVKRSTSQLNEARLTVMNVIAALERPSDAEAWHARMKQQGVSGNLLGLALPHVRKSAAIKVDQLVLKEHIDNNRLRLQGSVALWMGASVNQLMPFKYAVNAEFKDIESGPVMSRFELQEAQ